MKKIFTLFVALATTFSAFAADYTDNMSISLNGGEPTSQQATVSAVRSEDGDKIFYEIVLKQFSFNGLKIGDVTITGVGADDTNGMGGYSFFHETTKEAAITNGGAIASALGGKITVTIKDGSCVNNEKLYLDLNIPVKMAGVEINVDAKFGTAPVFPTAYNDQLVVTAMGQAMPAQDATILVTKQDNGKYTLSLQDFELKGVMTVGTVEMADVEGVEENGIVKLTTAQKVTIKEGSYPHPDGWGMAGIAVDVTLNAELNGDKLYAVIDILYKLSPDFSMPINVVFGSQSTGINGVTAEKHGKEAIYNISGYKTDRMQKGLNIVRKADGTTIKVMKR